MGSRVVIACVVLAWLAAAGGAFAQDKAQVERGAKVFADQKCQMCHAIGGKGNIKGALEGVGTKLKADEIRAWIVAPAEMTKKTQASRKPAMRAYPSLPKEDIDALVAYMASSKKVS